MNTATTTETYLVPEWNLEELEARIAKLNKRAVKLGVPEVVLVKQPDHVKHEIRQLTVNCGMNLCWATQESIEQRLAAPAEPQAFLAKAFEKTGRAATWYKVEVTGTTPSLNGWEFVAILEPMATDTAEVLNLVSTLPGQECPSEYRKLIGHCDHCQTHRKRNQTFVVRSETEGHKCVGRQCLKDFLGYNADPHALAQQAEMLAGLRTLCLEASDEEGFGGYGSRVRDSWDLQMFLTKTACRIRLFGWLGRGKAYDEGRQGQATADNVLELLTPPGSLASEDTKRRYREFVEAHVEIEEDKQTAESAIEWAKDITNEAIEGSNYLANVNLVARVGTVSRKTAGISASIIVGYMKEVEKEIKRQQRAMRPESKWIGEVGKRIAVMEVTCEKVIMKENQYGVTGIHKMVDSEGNDLTWFASGGRVIEEGETVKVAASVKAHDEWQGRKQTILSRVTVLSDEYVKEVEAKAAKKAARLQKKAQKETAS